MQSLALQGSINDLDGTLISYGEWFLIMPVPSTNLLLLSGPCQFPTLGFVVSRYEQVKSFAPEQFWYIHIALTSNQPGEGEVVTDFHWKRNRIFEIEVAAALYGLVFENPEARVTSVKRKNTKKWYTFAFIPILFELIVMCVASRKPYPLTTVELQKAASRILRLTPKKVLDVRRGFSRQSLTY